MKKSLKYYISIITITVLLLTGCASKQSDQAKTEAESAEVNDTVNSDQTATGNTDDIATAITTSSTTSQIIVDKEFTASDLEVGYEESTSTHITFEGSTIEVSGDGATYKDSILTISDEGTYIITGTLTNGQIVVDAEDTDKIQIVLNGVMITCSDNAPIYIKNADKVLITLKETTENTLIDGSVYVQTDDNTVDAAIFSTADLTINGDGTLNITGNYKHGIASKDDLIITGGTINITAVKDALNGKDCVKIKAGTLSLSATTGNGIQSKNGDDTTKGYVYIGGGDITIIKCQEGIEGTAIIIDDGTINITAEDDGLNSASGNTEDTETTSTGVDSTAIASGNIDGTDVATTEQGTFETGTKGPRGGERPEGMTEGEMPEGQVPEGFEIPEGMTEDDIKEHVQGGNFGGFGGGGNAFEVDTNCYLSINGGTITIDAFGDGIDSNGSVYITGGNTYVSGPTNSGNGGFDYNGTAEITGGTVIIVGSTGMAQGFSETSSQYSLLYNLTTVCAAGTEVKLTDQKGTVVATYAPNKQYQSVVISTPELAKDETYTLTCGDQTAEITLSTVVTSNGQQGMGGGGWGEKQDRTTVTTE